MKAYHILMFLFIFNMFLWVLTSVGVYVNFASSYASEDFQDVTQNKNPNLVDAFFGNFGFLSVVTLAGTLAGASIIGLVVAKQAPQGIVYGAFTWLFWTSYIRCMNVFYNISKDIPGGIPILGLITVIVAIIFIVGLEQMVTGGWSTYE